MKADFPVKMPLRHGLPDRWIPVNIIGEADELKSGARGARRIGGW